jgi:hypothetical protein
MLGRNSLPVAALLAALAGCGGNVVVDRTGGSGGSGGSSGTAGSGGTAGCGGSSFGCLQFCGSDFYPANSTCQGGAWVCPAGTVDPSTCPVSPCCTQDFDCGDAVFVPCVNGVCKPDASGGCWNSETCNGGLCQGVFVCPCGNFCDQPDTPGTCLFPP